MSYDRYKKFRVNGQVSIPPTVNIPVKSTDYYVEYKRGISRLDLISYDYYGDPNYDWLILMANPDVADMEFEIPDGEIIRVPYPLDITMENYNAEIDKYAILYGLN